MITVSERKSDRTGSLSSRFLYACDWEDGLDVECAAARPDCLVDVVDDVSEISVSTRRMSPNDTWGWGNCTRLVGSVAKFSCPHSQVITAPVLHTPTKEQAALRSWEVVRGIQSVKRYGTSRRHGGHSCLVGYATYWEVMAAVSESAQEARVRKWTRIAAT